MKIHLVTGVTGFVGKYLASALLEDGEQVWAVVRAKTLAQSPTTLQECAQRWPTSFRVVAGDVLQKNLGIDRTVLKELGKHEVVFWHLAANLSFAAQDRASVHDTNYRGTVNVLELANDIGSQFFYMSTAYVCGDASSLGEAELDKGQRFRNQYERSKFLAEAYVRGHCRLPFVVFRPSVIIGDAYHGKAAGCTFGYYRYMFVFHFLKQQIIKARSRLLFKISGTGYNATDDTLVVPWLVLPYPSGARVDLVTIDYVVESMITLYKKGVHNKTVHLTQNNLPHFAFLFDAILHDLGYRKVKLIPVPTWLFWGLLQALHFVAVPFRKYLRSVMWYVPYFTKRCVFEQTTAKKYLRQPPVISRAVTTAINTHAKQEILDHIVV